jgi:hypothetical protein
MQREEEGSHYCRGRLCMHACRGWGGRKGPPAAHNAEPPQQQSASHTVNMKAANLLVRALFALRCEGSATIIVACCVHANRLPHLNPRSAPALACALSGEAWQPHLEAPWMLQMRRSSISGPASHSPSALGTPLLSSPSPPPLTLLLPPRLQIEVCGRLTWTRRDCFKGVTSRGRIKEHAVGPFQQASALKVSFLSRSMLSRPAPDSEPSREHAVGPFQQTPRMFCLPANPPFHACSFFAAHPTTDAKPAAFCPAEFLARRASHLFSARRPSFMYTLRSGPGVTTPRATGSTPAAWAPTSPANWPTEPGGRCARLTAAWPSEQPAIRR